MSKYIIREMNIDESDILKDMLYEAIFQPDESNLLPKEIINEPELTIYFDNWGQKDDVCLVAVIDGKIVGAAWTRMLSGIPKGFGTIDDKTPELSISIYKDYRNKGIGMKLMKDILKLLSRKGYSQVSLSVQKKNYASQMYLKLGFEILEESEEEYFMVHNLKII